MGQSSCGSNGSNPFCHVYPGAYSFVLGHFYDEECGQTHYHEFEFTISINSQENCIKKKAQEPNNSIK